MNKKRVMFLIHDLGHGGAENVLVNLVNNIDHSRFDVTVIALFAGGVNESRLSPRVHYKTIFKKTFRGNSHIMKLFSPKLLHKLFIKDKYDIEVSYLEGPCARIISGCDDENTKLVSWIHCTMHSEKEVTSSFRNYGEAIDCYKRFDTNVFVSEGVKEAFIKHCPIKNKAVVLYNTNESDIIVSKSKDEIEDFQFDQDMFYWCGVGKLVSNKGFNRMLRIQKRFLNGGYKTHFIALGTGHLEDELKDWCKVNEIENEVTFTGYQTNPYKYVSKCDLFVCASHAEGFSTAATEALILGVPVCTVEVSGMREMLGYNNEYGLVVDNDDEALYQGIKRLLDDKELLQHYKQMAIERGKSFSTEKTVKAVEKMLMELINKEIFV